MLCNSRKDPYSDQKGNLPKDPHPQGFPTIINTMIVWEITALLSTIGIKEPI